MDPSHCIVVEPDCIKHYREHDKYVNNGKICESLHIVCINL